MRFSILFATAFVLAAAGCPHPRAEEPRVPLVDTPYELDDDLDLGERVDHVTALSPGPERTELRRAVAAAMVRRLTGYLDAGRLDRVDAVARELALLWQDEPAAMAPDLAPHVAALVRARGALARAS